MARWAGVCDGVLCQFKQLPLYLYECSSAAWNELNRVDNKRQLFVGCNFIRRGNRKRHCDHQRHSCHERFLRFDLNRQQQIHKLLCALERRWQREQRL